jgi:hypothetical protein
LELSATIKPNWIVAIRSNPRAAIHSAAAEQKGQVMSGTGQIAAADDREVLLGAADEIDAVALLEFAPEPEVDARRIPDEDGLLPDGYPFADASRAGALDGAACRAPCGG